MNSNDSDNLEYHLLREKTWRKRLGRDEIQLVTSLG